MQGPRTELQGLPVPLPWDLGSLWQEPGSGGDFERTAQNGHQKPSSKKKTVILFIDEIP